MSDLAQQARENPRQVVADPEFVLRLVAEPGLIQQIGPDALGQLVRLPEAPRALVQGAIGSFETSQNVPLADALLANPELTQRQAERLNAAFDTADDRNEAARFHAKLLREEPKEPAHYLGKAVLDHFQEFEGHPLYEATDLRNGFVLRTVLKARPDDLVALEWIIDFPLTPDDFLAYPHSGPGYAPLREALSRHGDALGDSLLEALSNEPGAERIAARPNLPEAALVRLLNSTDERVVSQLATNWRLTPVQQRALFEKGGRSILRGLAGNPNLTDRIELFLAGVDDAKVSGALLQRPSLKPATIAVLKQSNWQPVSKVANIFRPKWDRGRPSDNSAEVLDRIASPYPYFMERLLVATSSNAHEVMLEALANSTDALVRLAVAVHPNSSAATKELLAGDGDVRVARAAVGRGGGSGWQVKGTIERRKGKCFESTDD